MHTDSMYLTGTEYRRLFASKFLSKHHVKVEFVKMGNIGYYKITSDMPESAWTELKTIIGFSLQERF